MGLYGDFVNNRGKPTFKWLHYFPIYENHLSGFVNKSVSVLEIGVLDGGSLQMWRNYLGPHSQVIGIDINPEAKQHEDFQIAIEIGNQSDIDFLDSLFKRYGPFDIVIDDGSHKQSDLISTFSYFKDRMPKNGVYIIEDTHTAFVARYQDSQTDIFDYSFKIARSLSSNYAGRTLSKLSSAISSVNFYDSIICIEFKSPHIRRAIQVGNNENRIISRVLSPEDI